MHYPKPATARRRVRPVLLLPLALAVAATAIGLPWLSSTAATASETSSTGKYLGRWNYDQPDRATMTNIAESNAPGGLTQIPQVGDIVFTAAGADRIVGRTDVGCTWRFKVTPDSLALDPPAQLCHNPTSNVAYTINQWTVTVAQGHETETIIAKSHRSGIDYDFVLRNGARTKVKEYDPDASAKFTGAWAYDPADEATMANIRTTIRTAPDGTQTVERTEEQGNVTISRDYGNRITARTSEGCTWALVARGNTARLDPPVQTCTRSASTAITIRSWTIATDRGRQASAMTGTDEHGSRFTLAVGSLSRN